MQPGNLVTWSKRAKSLEFLHPYRYGDTVIYSTVLLPQHGLALSEPRLWMFDDLRNVERFVRDGPRHEIRLSCRSIKVLWQIGVETLEWCCNLEVVS